MSGAPLPRFDAVVVGGGIAGVSIGYELAAAGASVCLLEREQALAHHTTGRSAAAFLETYGGDQVRALTTGSRAFLTGPPEPWQGPLVRPRPLLQVAVPGREHVLERMHREVLALVPDAELVTPARAAELFPPLRPTAVGGGLHEPGSRELDVAALHAGYVRGLRARGGEIRRGTVLVSLRRDGAGWRVEAGGAAIGAGLVVDAAGAWADAVAGLAGAAPAGLVPRLRSVFMVDPPAGTDPAALPLVSDVDEAWYVKPEGAQLLCSPADVTPSEPRDASADPLEIARAIDAINAATTLGIRHVTRTWGGLRTFAPDGNPVIGHDPGVPGLFWFAGQGGFGIQTAPAAARLGAALALGGGPPADLVARGLDPARLAPGRPGPAAPA